MNFYVNIFPNSRILHIERYPEDESIDEHFVGMHGKVLTGTFELDGERFMCLDGGRPSEHLFDFNNAVSFLVECRDQAEIDFYWERLSSRPEEEQCGWCTDRFGLRWQIVPRNMEALMKKPAAIRAMMRMKKIDIKELEQKHNKKCAARIPKNRK